MPSRGPGTPADRAGRPRLRRGRPPGARPGAAPAAGVGRWAVAVLLLAAAACAKEEPPPGAEPDQSPPDIREIVPADGTVDPEHDGPIRVRFDEPIEPPRGLARQLEASPFDEYRVEFGFDEIRVRPAEGWRPGAVYWIRFPGTVSDLLRNEREEPFEVTFSTGPPITDTRVSGRIVDRVDRRPQQGARALFLPVGGDSVPYGAVADTGGRFDLRALPPGAYRAYGFRDLNANRSLERRLEPWDSASFRLPDPASSAELRLSLLEPDSTPPRLARAEALDSTAVELTFDDHLDPAQDVRPGQVTLTAQGGDTVEVAGIGLTREGAGLAAPDTARPTGAAGAAPGDTAAGPDTAAAPDTAGAGDTATPDGARAADTAGAVPDTAPAAADTLPLPSRSVLVRPARPLGDSVRYRVGARGFRNLQGLAGGGDTTFVHLPAPDTAGAGAGEAADTAAAGVPPADSLPPRDSLPASDSLPPADSTPAGEASPDTASVGGDPP